MFRMERVTYRENGIECLTDCNLQIFSGEILGLIPLNSNGLSSLLDVMTQNLPLEFGFVFLREKKINSWHYPHPRHNPVGLIQSKSQLVEGLSLAENVFVLRRGFRSRFIQSRLLRDQLQPFFEKIDVDIPPESYPENLGIFQRIIVELIRAIVAGYHLIILYDVSTFLNEKELESLHRVLRQCAQEGYSFLYIGSQPEDLYGIADRISVFSNGCILKTVEEKDSLQEILDNTRIQEEIPDSYNNSESDGAAILRVENLALGNMEALSFQLHPGECIAVQDVDNRNNNLLIQILLGEHMPDSGKIWLHDQPFSPGGNRELAIIQEQPTKTMLFPELSYFDNLFMTSDHEIPHLWRNRRMQQRLAKEYEKRTGKELFERSVDSLSEQEKFELVYNRIILQHPSVVICIHPFTGTDMELRALIRQLLSQMRQKQIAVILITANATETVGIADRMIRVHTLT